MKRIVQTLIFLWILSGAGSFLATEAAGKDLRTVQENADVRVSSEVQEGAEVQETLGLEIARVSESGVVCLSVPAGWESCEAVGRCAAFGETFPIQCVLSHGETLAIFQLPPKLKEAAETKLLTLEIHPSAGTEFQPVRKSAVKIETPAFTLEQTEKRLGGLPSRVKFASGKELLELSWEERIFDGTKTPENQNFAGVWSLANDSSPTLEVVSDGPFCTVVRQTASYARLNGSVPPSAPQAVYDWFYFKNADGLVLVRAAVSQKEAHTWKELHIGEVHLNQAPFPYWAGGDSAEAVLDSNVGNLKSAKEVQRRNFSRAAGFWDGENLLAMYAGKVLLYGDVPGKRIYLHAYPNLAWKSWSTAKAEVRSFLLRFGSLDSAARGELNLQEPEKTAPARLLMPEKSQLKPKFFRFTPVSREKTLSSETEEQAGKETESNWSREYEYARKLANRDSSAEEVRVLDTWTLRNEDLAAVLVLREEKTGGQTVSLEALADVKSDFLLAQTPQEIFSLTVEDTETKTQTRLTSRTPWRSIQREDGLLTFTGPLDLPEGEKLQVRVSINPETELNSGTGSAAGIPAFGFGFSVSTNSAKIRPLSASAGRLLVENTGLNMQAFHPGGCGTLVQDPANSEFQREARYPSLKAVMPWLAFWDLDRGTGIYAASLDPSGSVKEVTLSNLPGSGKVLLEVSQPLPIQAENPGAETRMAGTFIWQRLDGDWYTAALRYRDWVRRNAGWYPKVGPEGRVSTPLWMKRLCVWGRVFGSASKTVPVAKEFIETLGVPVGIHWYHWHQIPFDDDYPHYLPPKAGFAEGVKAMQDFGCRVVPYTNGRLWDTRDRGTEDFLFTKRGLPGASKKEDGSPVTETYRSYEKDGSKVVLAVMCPGSEIWKETVSETNRRLICEYGLDGVYMDQIACAAPAYCEDPTHGHPLRGGDWWTNEYRELLVTARERIQKTAGKEVSGMTRTEIRALADSPKDFIFSSESNVETCANDIDGMVCWHIEGNDVPAWCVVYSGVTFPYGRAYDENVRSMRMKWANNLVNGDQPGWFPPKYLQKPELGEYLRKLVRFRFHSVEYFYLGELLRAPRLHSGEIPVWSEDWNIFRRFSINTMPVVQTAARRILRYEYDSAGNRLWDTGKVERALLIFTNFSFEGATSRVEIDWEDLGIEPKSARIFRVNSEGEKTPMALEELELPISFPAGETWGVEILAP